MSQLNDTILSSIILMERIIPRLNGNSRETIKRQKLKQIDETLSLVLQYLNGEAGVLILTPIMEVVQLIDNVTADDSFVETDAETKELIISRLTNALTQMYLFAGKYYMDHEFTYSITKTEVLRNIVNVCMDHNFYFGYDVQLRKEGAI